MADTHICEFIAASLDLAIIPRLERVHATKCQLITAADVTTYGCALIQNMSWVRDGGSI